MKEETFGDLLVRWQGEGDGPTVVLFHGFGAPGTDLVPLADAIDAPEGTRFLFPEAPQVLPPELGMGNARAWWMIDLVKIHLGTRVLEDEDPPELPAMRERVLAMLDAFEAAHGLDRSKLILGGFSQGSMLAIDVALETDLSLAALVVMSGTYLASARWSSRLHTRAGLPVLQSHGDADPVLPVAIAEKLRDAMGDAGLDVTYLPFAGGHGIGPGVLRDLGAFLSAHA